MCNVHHTTQLDHIIKRWHLHNAPAAALADIGMCRPSAEMTTTVQLFRVVSAVVIIIYYALRINFVSYIIVEIHRRRLRVRSCVRVRRATVRVIGNGRAITARPTA